MSVSENNRRIAKNTLMLYLRQILILLVSLYTVRVVLNVIGVEDYGVYSVIGGIVSLFSFLSGTMASATQRFFSYALGRNDLDKLMKTFTINLVTYGVIAFIALILLETVGLWFVKELLIVPPERYTAALFIYHFSILSFIATILLTPFMAIIIAHEDMQIYVYVSIAETAMNLCILFLLMYLPWDKLELYGVLVFIVSILKAIIYISVCSKKYIECQYRKFHWDNVLLYEILGFTGWTLLGQVSVVGRNQAITILLNQVFNPVVVAARAIATQITNQINIFSNNFNIGLYPPIIKSYATGNDQDLFSLIFNGSKITFFLMWVFALPIFLEMNTILNIWLSNPPLEAVLFTRLALVEVLITSISMPIVTAARAPGKMRAYELSLGSINIAIFFTTLVLLKMGGPSYSVYFVAIVANFVMFIVRLLIVKHLIGLPIKKYFYEVVFPVFFVIIVSTVPSLVVTVYIPKGFFFIFLTILLTMIFSTVSMFFLGLDAISRNQVKMVISNRFHKKVGG